MPSLFRPDMPRRTRLLAFAIPALLLGLFVAYTLGSVSAAPALPLASGSPWTFNQLIREIDSGSVVAVVPATGTLPTGQAGTAQTQGSTTTGSGSGQAASQASGQAAAAAGSSMAAQSNTSAQSGTARQSSTSAGQGTTTGGTLTGGTSAGQGTTTGGTPTLNDKTSAAYSAGPAESVVAAAQTTSGQVIPIASATGAAGVVDALRVLGYANVISPEAAQRWPASGGGFDPGSSLPALLIGVGLGIMLFAAAASIARNRRRQTPDRWSPRASGGGNSPWAGSQQPKNETATNVRFDDVAGVEEAKLELAETVEFLKSPGRFRALGAKPVRGVLLSGPPGTGKTLLAKAVAHEAGVPFFAASGSEFVERYVGVGAERVRSLFTKAREAGRGVIFIDEIDAVAKIRGGPNSHDEREQTLNQLLVEMDGFGSDDNVVVMAATNRVDTLDPALLRPGRFTRKIHVPLPDRDAREAILAVHAANKPLQEDVDLAAVARRTYGFSGAMLADLLNEAAIFAARGNRKEVTVEDVHRGWLKVAVGTARQRSMDERERMIIAAHETGHAICGVLAGDGRRVEEISLFQHGEALGVTVSSGDDDALPSEARLRARLVALMGGRAAEELVFGEVTGGASNDFEQATKLATQMVTKWGLGADPSATDPGPTGRGLLSTFVVTTEDTPQPAELVAAQARAIRAILDEAYADSRELLQAERERLDRVAAYLFEHERMSGDELEGVLDGTLASAAIERWRELTAAARQLDALEEGDISAAWRRARRWALRRQALPRAGGVAVAAAQSTPAPSGADVPGLARSGGRPDGTGQRPDGTRQGPDASVSPRRQRGRRPRLLAPVTALAVALLRVTPRRHRPVPALHVTPRLDSRRQPVAAPSDNGD